MATTANRRRTARLALATVAATALLGGSAQAETVTVGSPLTANNFAQQPFVGGATVANFILPAPNTAVSPTDGTVISWRFIGAGGAFAPRVLRSTGGTSHTGAATGVAQVPSGAPPAVSGPFNTSLPIKRGELIGVNVPAAGTLGIAPTSGSTYLQWTPPLGDGVAGQPPTTSVASEAAISAVVRFCKVPRLKGLGGQAARQALLAANCTIGNVTKSTTKRRPTKQVLTQSVKANQSIADTAPVDFVVAPKKKPKKKKKNKKKRKRKKRR